ncbi:helix-turn-helix domain-containing protein [Hwanghaeella grinnelliae]|uniref:Helix-turn-helix domain-containing protein n=1 Tax=Hwanghaeella grinnelliae TaxID=2500179 RepID=A0A3S2W855_9PROT|nr:helix-turn-helix domain-containing protein [Hwanghaeella grinnelliae]RVU35109.1 helix-turn-helix domain-containing protein [Hwanghaeella grinnelliae]
MNSVMLRPIPVAIAVSLLVLIGFWAVEGKSEQSPPLCGQSIAETPTATVFDHNSVQELLFLRADFLLDTSGAERPDDLDGKDFLKSPCLDRYPAPAPGAALWLRFSIQNDTNTARDWRIGFSEYLYGSTILYRDDPQSEPLAAAGRSVPRQERTFISLRPQLPLSLAAGEKRTYYLRIAETWDVAVTPYVMSPATAYTQNEFASLVSALFLGFLAATLVISLVLFRHADVTNYQFYSLYVISMLVSSLLYDGWFHHLTESGLDFVLMVRAIEALFALCAVGYVLFCQNILTLTTDRPKWPRFFSLGLGALTVSAVFAVLDPWIFDLPLTLVILFLQLGVLVAAVMRIKDGIPEAKPVAASAASLFILITIGHIPYILTFHLDTADASTKLAFEQMSEVAFYAAVLGEAIFMGIAIAVRVNSLQAQRLAATAEANALKHEAQAIRATLDEARRVSGSRIAALETRLIETANDTEKVSLAPADSRFLDWAKELVQANIGDPAFGVRQLSAALGTSEKTLGRRLKQSLGLTPVAFIRQERLNRARDMLLIRQFNTVAETAHAVGFSSTGHFAKLYREAFGETPNATLRAAIRDHQD